MKWVLCGFLLILGVGCTTIEVPEIFDEEDTVHSSHLIQSLEVGADALLARIHLIRQAREEILIQTFIWGDDEVGRLLYYELLQAAKRGVHVKIIADHMFSMSELAWLAFACQAHPNLQIRLYNPSRERLNGNLLSVVGELTLNFSDYNSRMHNKLFVVDGDAVTGGRNYENCYYDRSTRLNFKDRDVWVRGPVVEEMKKSFYSYWDFPLVVEAAQLTDVAKLLQAARPLPTFQSVADFGVASIFQEISEQLADPAVIQRLTAFTHEVEKVAFFADPPGKNMNKGIKGSSRLNETLVAYIREAQSSVIIQSPYLVLSNRGLKLFEGLREKQPDIELTFSTNSLAATDSWPTYAMLFKQKQALLEDLEATVFEYKPLPKHIREVMPNYPQLLKKRGQIRSAWNAHFSQVPYLCLHSKTLVIDEKITFIGSYNVDPRSANLNTEVKLVIWDKAFAKDMRREIKLDCAGANSWVVAKSKRLPVFAEIDDILGQLSAVVASVTTLDLWGAKYASCFELKDGFEACAPTDANFYQNYQDVGNFPELSFLDDKAILVKLFKSVGSGLKPIL